MPSNVIKRASKQLNKSIKTLEEQWEEAKKQAKENGQENNYGYIMTIWKQMTGYKPKTVSEALEVISEFEDFYLDEVGEKEAYKPFKNIEDRDELQLKKDPKRNLEKTKWLRGRGKMPIEKVLLHFYGFPRTMYSDMNKINAINRRNVLNHLTKKFSNTEFTFKKALASLNFEYPQVVQAILDDLVDNKQLIIANNRYKIAKNDIDVIVNNFVNKYKPNVSATRLSIIAKTECQDNNADDIEKFLKRKVTANTSPNVCIRCGGVMEEVEIENGIKAYYCPNDRVTLPRK